MTVSLDIFVPLEPNSGLGPNARLHWRQKAALVRDARGAAKYATINRVNQELVVFPKEYPIEIECVVHWEKGRKVMDEDNALAILKPYFDGVADGIEVDDSYFRILSPVRQQMKSPSPGVVIGLLSLFPG
jgi:hypothetical protein